MPWPITTLLPGTRHRAGVPPRRRAAGTAPAGRRRAALLAAAAVAATGAACTSCSGIASATGRDPYTIGLITSRTGGASQLGVGELQGAQLAVDRINAAGGVNGHKLRLRTADDQSSPEQAVLATRRMLPGVGAVIGSSLTGACNAIAPLTTGGHLLNYCLSPGIHPKPGSTTWSASAESQSLAARLIGYWRERGITRIGLLSTTDASGMEGARAVRAAVAGTHGVRLTGAASYDPTAISITPQLQVATANRPQAMIVWASGAAAGVAFKGLAQQGNTLPVATTDANLTYTFVRRIAAFAPKTLLIPATRDFWGAQAGGDAATLDAAYRKAFRARYGAPPDFGPGVAYDAVMLVAKALGEARGNAGAAPGKLEAVRGFRGVLGTYSFSPDDHRGLGIGDVAVVRATATGFTYAGR